GLARLAGEPGTRAFGTPAPPDPTDEPTPEPSPEPGAPGVRAFGGDPATPAAPDPSDFDDLPTPSGVRIDAPTAGPDPEPPDEEVDEDELTDDAGPISGSVQAVGPEAPGIDWGVGPEALKPQRRPSGWHLDEDGNPIGEPFELPKRSVGQQYRHAPIWARIAIPLVALGLVALAVTSLLGGSDGDGEGADRLFSTRDGTLDEEELDEPGMDDALTRARQRGVPAEINDKDLSGLIKGVCTAARRSLVSLSLSQALVDTGLEVGDLGEAATAIGNGSLEYCPDQEAALGQVVSVLITRTQRMLATSTTT
ncbi:MAG: hypothetical protein M3Z03_16695, partial [Actinomycetota bacterium]|nr:hypothetical protein [Actinomycetota bacterium]